MTFTSFVKWPITLFSSVLTYFHPFFVHSDYNFKDWTFTVLKLQTNLLTSFHFRIYVIEIWCVGSPTTFTWPEYIKYDLYSDKKFNNFMQSSKSSEQVNESSGTQNINKSQSPLNVEIFSSKWSETWSLVWLGVMTTFKVVLSVLINSLIKIYN